MQWCELSPAKTWMPVNRLVVEGKLLLPLTWLTISLYNQLVVMGDKLVNKCCHGKTVECNLR